MIFTIKKGKHYSNNWFYKLTHLFNFKQELKFKVKFDESCLYNFQDEDKHDINKLFGFSIGFHHKNSLRFGWNVVDNKIIIYYYNYIDGKRINEVFVSCNVNEELLFEITNPFYNEYNFTITDLKNGTSRWAGFNIKGSLFSLKYNLWPYFGGNKTAPHNIKIELK